MSQTPNTEANADQIIHDMKAKGMIPSGPAPARRHRIAEALAYILSGACLGLAVIVAALIVIEVLTP